MSCCDTSKGAAPRACGCGATCRTARSAIVGAAAISFLGIAVGAVHSWLRPVALSIDTSKVQGTVLPTPAASNSAAAPAATTTQPQASTSPEAVPPAQPASVTLGLEIDSAQAKLLYDMGVPFIDAREPDVFAQGHVDRSLNYTADQVIPHAADLVRWRPGPIVVYCSGGDCDASHHVAQRLQELQFTQIHIMTDGYQAWKDKGFPTVSGK